MIGRLRMDAKTPISAEPGAIRLVIADVDGTLVTSEKVLTPRTRVAVRALLEAGIAFTITSGRPPRGMKPLVDALALVHPILSTSYETLSTSLPDFRKILLLSHADNLTIEVRREGNTTRQWQKKRS